jgi:type VI secretion system protein ImpK
MAHLIDCYMELMVFVRDALDKHPVPDFEQTRSSIELLIERSKQKASRAKFSENIWLEGFFPVTAWIDETILCSEWQWREQWSHCQLQRRYFNMSNAGDIVFQKLQNLKQMAAELLSVYDIILATGFRGCYYRSSDDQIVNDIRQQIDGRLSKKINSFASFRLFEDAYQLAHGREQQANKKFFSLENRLGIAMAILPVIVLIVLHVMLEMKLDQQLERYFGKGM